MRFSLVNISLCVTDVIPAVRQSVSSPACSSSMLSTRPATPADLLEVLALYRDFNQAEPCSLSLGLPDKHLETQLAVIASFQRLIHWGCVLLSCEAGSSTLIGQEILYSDWLGSR